MPAAGWANCSKARRARLREQGLCRDCMQPSVTVRCVACRAKHAAQEKINAPRRPRAICAGCGRRVA